MRIATIDGHRLFAGKARGFCRLASSRFQQKGLVNPRGTKLDEDDAWVREKNRSRLKVRFILVSGEGPMLIGTCDGDPMRVHVLILLPLMLPSLGCSLAMPLATSALMPPAPRPLEALAVGDEGALVQAEVRQYSDIYTFAQLSEALLDLGCHITASDGATGVISFRKDVPIPREPSVHRGWPCESAVMEGTLLHAHPSKDTRLRVVLSGTMRWSDLHGSARTERLPRLSVKTHLQFLDQLEARLKTQITRA